MLAMVATAEAVREMWMQVARAAARRRRLLADGAPSWFLAPTLPITVVEIEAGGSLTGAIRRALTAGVDPAAILDAILSADPTIDLGECGTTVE